MKVKPNKKISNNEPLERRTEFERKKKMLSKRRPPDNLWRENLYERKTTTPKKKTQKKKTNEKMKEM